MSHCLTINMANIRYNDLALEKSLYIKKETKMVLIGVFLKSSLCCMACILCRDPPGYPGAGPLHITHAELTNEIFTKANVWRKAPQPCTHVQGRTHYCTHTYIPVTHSIQGWEIEELELSEYFHTPWDGGPYPQQAWLVVARRI